MVVDEDTVVIPHTKDAAFYAVGAACRLHKICIRPHCTPPTPDNYSIMILYLTSFNLSFRAVDLVLSGAKRNAFCCIRPPGHHAEPQRVMGKLLTLSSIVYLSSLSLSLSLSLVRSASPVCLTFNFNETNLIILCVKRPGFCFFNNVGVAAM